MEDLPPEILVLIFANLPLTSLLNGVSPVCKKFYFLVRHEIRSGRLAFDLEISPRNSYLPHLRLNSLKLTGFSDKSQIHQVLDRVNPDIQLHFDNCPAVKSLDFVKPGLKGLHFGPEDSIPTRVYQDVASFKGLMSSLTLPRIPQIFVPLILARQQNVTELEIGECSNQVAFMICKRLENLTSFAFNGEGLTYSGVIGLVSRKDKLRSLSIKNPRSLTKYSLKLLSRHLTQLENLSLYWNGKLLINNPWNFEFCLDREKQKVDNLFAEGRLHSLKTIDLSSFYQTVDDNALQVLASAHLASGATVKNHLKKIFLSHCYRVTDNGIQWLVGSCHSPKIHELNLSNTGLTGNCFLRKMHSLTSLELDCCSSLKGPGLQCISSTCHSLKKLSLSQNKQIEDEDLAMAFKSGLTHLEEFYANYTSIVGSCFREFQSFHLKRLGAHSNTKLKDDLGVLDYLLKGSRHLSFVDLSASGITGSIFERCYFPNLKTLLLDFCPKLKSLNQKGLPKLSYLSIYGTPLMEPLDSENLSVVFSSGCETEAEIQEFARKRDLRITNWEVTRKSMVKGVPFMLSQVYLTSLADRE